MEKVILTGRLGKDPEIRYTTTNKAVCNLNLAVTEKVKRGAGFEDSVTWHRIVLWQRLAEDAKDLKKGAVVRVEGFQKSRTFTGRDNKTRTIIELVAETFDVLDSLPQTPAAPPKARTAGPEWDSI
jgi:single-strand DNA-binding protein